MRIVAGLAKGRRVAVPSKGTRPTSDRAREGLFNTLRTEIDLDGARVLDLFAGSGAVGIEALSRGAAAAVFVENDRDAAKVLAANIAEIVPDLDPSATTSLQRADVQAWLASTPASPFDIVFADPPYALADADLDEILATLVRRDLLVEGAIVVIERSSRGPALQFPPGITMIKDRRYGEGTLWYGRRE